jgi:acyl-CoA thioesterase FadM
VGLFVKGKDCVAATGYFVDVYVDAATEKPIAIPEEIRTCLEKIAIS